MGKYSDKVFDITVNRNLTHRQEIDSLRLRENIDTSLLNIFPEGGAKEERITLFHLRGNVRNKELEIEYCARGLVPVDIYSIIALNKNYPRLAVEQQNATHWQGGNGKWYCAAFLSLGGETERWICIHLNRNDWLDWWHVGRSDNKVSVVEDMGMAKRNRNPVPCLSH